MFFTIYSPLTPLIKKVFTGFISTLILLNTLIPKNNIIESYEIPHVINSQYVLAKVFYHTTIPITILNDILRDNLLQGTLNPNNPFKSSSKKETESSSSSPYAVVSNQIISSFFNNVNSNSNILNYNKSSLNNIYLNYSTAENFKQQPLLILIFLIFFFILPRSSINENVIKYIKSCIKKPNLKTFKLGFLFI